MNYDFYKCTDTKCLASGKYNKIINTFTHEGIHLQYENILILYLKYLIMDSKKK